MTLDWQQLFTWLWWWLLTKCQSPLLTTVLLNFSKFDKLKIELSSIWRKLRITLENHFFIYLACNQSLYFRLSWFTFALWDNLWFCFSFIQYKPENVFGMVCPCCRGTIWCSTSLIFFFCLAKFFNHSCYLSLFLSDLYLLARRRFSLAILALKNNHKYHKITKIESRNNTLNSTGNIASIHVCEVQQ